MKVISFANQKGGTGKTTLSVLFNYFLIEKGFSTLFIDLDSQKNSSKTLSDFAVENLTSSMLFAGEIAISDDLRSMVSVHKTALISADFNLDDVDRISDTSLATNYFKTYIDVLANDNIVDFVIIDNAPSLSFKMTAALFVSDFIVSPIELEEYSFDGIAKMYTTIENMKKFNPKLNFLGMIPNRVRGNSPRQQSTLKALQNQFSKIVLPFVVKDTQAIPESLGMKIPVWKLQKTSAREVGRSIKKLFNYLLKQMDIK